MHKPKTSPSRPDTCTLLWLSVLPAYRRRGIGAALIKHIENYIADKFFKDKNGVINLVSEHDKSYYEKLGYKDSLKTHNGHPVMVKQLVYEND